MFSEMKYLSYTDSEILKRVNEINTKINNKLKTTYVKDYIPKNTTDLPSDC